MSGRDLSAAHDFRIDCLAVQSIPSVPTILDVVCRTTGMGFAAVARVTEDRWVACQVRDDIAFGLQPGDELEIRTTICNEIRQSGTAVVIDHVAADPAFCAHPTPAQYGFQSYISMPIKLPDGTFFGTLCAIDPKPAVLNTPAIIGLFRMFADLIGFHLDANQRVASSRETLRLYENIIQSHGAPICAFDHNYRLIAFNKAHNDEFFRVNGFYTKIGDVFPDLFIPDQAVIMRANMRRALRGETYTVEAVFGRPEFGQPCWEITYTPLRNETGDIIGAFHQAHDISARLRAETELREAQETLRQSQKLEAVGQLTGGVAHDFNNLLTIIRSSVDFLRRPDLPEARRTRYVDAVSETVDRAAKLTGQLLAFARRQTLKPEVFEVGPVLRSVADMLDTVTGARIRVVTDGLDTPCFVKADISQFETALVNMAVNARDAMDGGGTLTLRLIGSAMLPPIRGHGGAAGPFAAVSLIDTGSGIAPDVFGRIFEPFFTTKEVGKGTGLGLSQVFGFAKQSGGDVDVASVQGQGTTFTLYLPEIAAETDPKPVEGLKSDGFPMGHGQCVLVVEDNIEVGRFATQILEDLGYRTTWVMNAEEALETLGPDGSGFAAVFSDVVMPGMGGIALAKALQHRLPHLPVVLASGYSHVLAQEGPRGIALLHKPYSADQLGGILGRIIRQRSTAPAG
jgi:PAS domain S-box-containing protein